MSPPGGSGKHRPPEPQVQPWHATSADEEVRALFQERFRLFMTVALICSVTMLVFIIVMYEFYPDAAPLYLSIQHGFSAVGLTLLVIFWYGFLRSGRRTALSALRNLDAACLTIYGMVFGFDAYLSADRAVNMYATFIWMCFIVFGRVLYVPSTARRTFWVSVAAMAPMNVGAVSLALDYAHLLEVPPIAFVLGSFMYTGLVVFISTVGSQVIYGLRKEVREAQQLGQYTLGEKIGEGGMGAVYMATHAMLRRPTAIKLLPPDRTSEEHLVRFEREVRLTAQLTSPNTVEIFDYGRSPDGVFYYAMEYLDGLDLERLVRIDGPQPAARVIHMLSQACSALEEAHDRGLVHRDVKPGNLILCRRGKLPDFVKVVDFGLVKDIQSGTDLTGDMVAGTPAYLSPEGVTNPATVGPAGDLYAIGALGYFLLTGTTVFDAANVVEMCVHHVDTPPTPPSERTDNPIPDALERLLLQCLEKRPEDRPNGAGLVRKMLDALPEANDWNEETALEWWIAYESRPSAKHSIARPEQSTMLSPLTMTVDIRGRTTQ